MSQFKVYQRGAIVFLDFGKNIGYEFNGKHFAIVLNKEDNVKSGTLQVVPLTSKDKKSRHVKIEKSVIETIIIDSLSYIFDIAYISGQIGRKRIIVEELNRRYPEQNIAHWENDPRILTYLTKKNVLLLRHTYDEVLAWVNEDLKKANEVIEYYKKYNKKSYARVDAMKQIDKSRIIGKLNEFDPIGDVLLPEKYMRRIKSGIIHNYID